MTTIVNNIATNTINSTVTPIVVNSTVSTSITGVSQFNGRRGNVVLNNEDVVAALGYTPASIGSAQARCYFDLTGQTSPAGAGNEQYDIDAEPNTRPARSTTPTTTTPTFSPTTSNQFLCSAVDSDGSIMAWDGSNLYYSENNGAAFSNSGVTFDVALPTGRFFSAMGVIPSSPKTWVFLVGNGSPYSSNTWAVYTSTDRRTFTKMTNVQSDAYFTGWGASFSGGTQIPFNGAALQMSGWGGTDRVGYFLITSSALTAVAGVSGGQMYSSAFNGSVLISCGLSGAIQTASSTNTNIAARTSGTANPLYTASTLGDVTICAGYTNTVVANTDGTGAAWSAQSTGVTGTPTWYTSTVDRANNRIIIYGDSGWRAICTVTGTPGNYTLSWSASQVSGNNAINTAVHNATTSTENVFGSSGANSRRLVFNNASLTLTQPGYGLNPALSVTYQMTAADSERTIPTALWNLISPLRPAWTVTGLNTPNVHINTNDTGSVPDVSLTLTGSFASGGVNITTTRSGAPNDVLTITNPLTSQSTQYPVAQGRSTPDIGADIALNETLMPSYYVRTYTSDNLGITRLEIAALVPQTLTDAQLPDISISTQGAGSTLAVSPRSVITYGT